MKTRSIILIILIIVLAAALGWYTYARQPKTTTTLTNELVNITTNQVTNSSLDPVETTNLNGNTNQVQVDQFGQYE